MLLLSVVITYKVAVMTRCLLTYRWLCCSSPYWWTVHSVQVVIWE